DIPPIPVPSAPRRPSRLEELELHHLLVADLAIEVLARELEVLVEAFEHHLGGEGALFAAFTLPAREVLQAGNAEDLGLVIGERLLVGDRHRVAVREPADDAGVGAAVFLAAAGL